MLSSLPFRTCLALISIISSSHAHISLTCVSIYDSFNQSTCNKALLWIATYNHGARQGITIPGKVVVSVGGNNYVSPSGDSSPYPFENFCLHNADARANIGSLESMFTSSSFLNSCPSQDRSILQPQLGQAEGQDKSKFQLRCFDTWDTSTGDVVLREEDSFMPNCNYMLQHRQWAYVELAGLDTTTGGQDITVAMQNVDVNYAPSGTKTCLAPIYRQSTSSTDLFNDAFYRRRYMNIKPDQIFIPGCGKPCGPYTETIAHGTHACNADVVASGTNCDVKCNDGFLAAGSDVICNAGTYTGGIVCTDQNTATPGCSQGKCTNINVPGGDTIVSTPGCGERVESGTCCDIACSSAERKYSVGFVCAQGTSFVNQEGTECRDCKGDSCTVNANDENIEEVDEDDEDEPRDPLNDVVTPDGVVCVKGQNFNPIRDKVIIIKRNKGENPSCSNAGNKAYGEYYLQCNSTKQSCGFGPDDFHYVCDGATSLPDYGKVCICDADAVGGCVDLPSKYAVDGPITRLSIHPPPSASPSASPTAPTVSPTTSFPTTSPTISPTPCYPLFSNHDNDTAFANRMEMLCPSNRLLPNAPKARAPDFTGSAKACGGRGQQRKWKSILRQSLANHLFYSQSTEERCDAWCVGDITEGSKKFFVWNRRKSCWKVKRRGSKSKCKLDSQEFAAIANRKNNICAQK